MKPHIIEYCFHVPTFKQVKISDKSGKFLIFYLEDFDGNQIFVESKNYIIGGFGFILKRDELDIEYYSSYEECIEVIKNRTWDNLSRDFDIFRVKSDILIAEKNGNK